MAYYVGKKCNNPSCYPGFSTPQIFKKFDEKLTEIYLITECANCHSVNSYVISMKEFLEIQKLTRPNGWEDDNEDDT